MGYDIKMFVGERVTIEGCKHDRLIVIGMVNLCHVSGGVYKLSNKSHNPEQNEGLQSISFDSECFCNDNIVELDYYDMPMYPVSLGDALVTLKKENKVEQYRRYELAINLLETIDGQFKEEEDIVVIFFGC